jgi:alpha/beta superfamily hydrolase
MGGTMDNTIVVALCRALAARGWATLRFDFRGAGRSEGAFDAGHGEMDDVAGALDFLCAQADVDPDRLAVMGYSFGAGVALHHSVRDSRPRWLAGIALVQEHHDDPFLDADPRPKLFVAGERDPWAPPEPLRAYVARLRPPAALQVVPDTDHFFGGRESEVAEIIAEWLQDQAADCGPP